MSATPLLPAPPGVSVTAGNAQVAVSWAAVSGATRYTVYYSQSPISDLNASGVRSVSDTGALMTTVTGLINGTQYYFKVTATNAGGEGAASTEVSATPQIPAPTGLSVTAGNTQVAVSWMAVSGATGYTVYYSQSMISDISASGVRSMNATGTSVMVTGLINGTLYYFKVTATDAGGESAASSEASATPQVPGAPGGLSLSAGDGQVEASWTAVNGATRYTVYYSQSSISDINASGVRSMNATSASATVTGLINGTQYYFKVTATNAGGESAASTEASATPQVPAPGAPTGLSVTAGNARAAVRWTAVSGATGYTMYYSQSSISDIRASGVRSMNVTGTSPTVTGLTNGTQYYFRVTATSTGGESAASNEASTMPWQIPAGTVFRDFLSGGGQGPQMVALPTGSFSMGSPATETGRRSNEGPVRTVTISKRIAMSRYEITFEDYDRFADAHSNRSRPSDSGWGRGTRPVINVNWNEARAYAAWLSVQTGKSYRLPSEAEWEYAARAGTSTAYSFGNSITCSQANYDRFSGNSCNTGRNARLVRTVAVGRFAANAFGLHDMHGNVWEWVEDCYVNTYTGAPSDGSARTTGCGTTAGVGVVRGGSWTDLAPGLRSAVRSAIRPTDRGRAVGFRLVQDLNPSPPGAPISLSLTAGDAQVAANWNIVPGATGYTLYYSQSSFTSLTAQGVTSVRNLTTPSHTVTGLTNGTQYYFRVTATNPGGQGDPSTEAFATPQVPAPGAPSSLSLSAGNAQATASWAAVSGATSYTLYYSESSISTLTAAGVTAVPNLTGTSRTVTGLTNSTLYYFKVTASNAGGEGAASTEASTTPGGAGVVFRDALSGGGQGPQMVALRTGSFSMGSHQAIGERPVHTVTISERIAMSKYEITFEDYDRFADAHSSRSRPSDSGWGRGTRPVINVNWNEAKAYAAWLSTQTGKSYRLPSEAEWEYAARAGTFRTLYSWGDRINCSQANYGNRIRVSIFITSPTSSCNGTSNSNLARTVAVGSYAANAFGLHDMHGNVYEWVEDCYVSEYVGAPSDGSARTTGCGTGTYRSYVVRGGAWSSSAQRVRSAARWEAGPSARNNAFGFRLVQDLNP